jgi:hypothetical protein
VEHQLQLLEDRQEWRLDDQTRERGRQGVAEARAVLAQLRRSADARHAA